MSRSCLVLSFRCFGLIKSSCRTDVWLRKNSTSTCKFVSPPLSDRILKSHVPDLKIPELSLPEIAWKDHENVNDLPAITCGVSGRSYTYLELRLLAERMASAFLTVFHMEPGDVVGLHLPNVPEYVIACYGAMEAGLIVCPTNPLNSEREIQRQFDMSNVRIIVTVGPLYQQAANIKPTHKDFKGLIVVGAEEFDVPVNNQTVFDLTHILMTCESVPLPSISPDCLACQPSSSGTTDFPKTVMLSHRNLVSNVMQIQHPDFVGAVRCKDKTPGHPPSEVAYSVLPFFHIYGFTILNVTMALGFHLVTMPRFLPDIFLKNLLDYQPHSLFLVPTLLNMLATNEKVLSQHLASLKNVVCGSSHASLKVIDSFLEKARRDDISVRQGYGMTESSPVVLLSPVNVTHTKAASCGKLVPNTKAIIMDVDKQRPNGPFMPGELLVTGPQIMVGYLNNEDATSKTVDVHGWLHSGDVAYYDDEGYFFVVDRTKDLIKVKSYQVSPNELEQLLRHLPGVVDAAVIGIPDSVSGELPLAFIIEEIKGQLTEEKVKEFLHPQVAKYKRLLGGVIFIEDFPRNAYGKVLKNELRTLAAKIKKNETKE